MLVVELCWTTHKLIQYLPEFLLLRRLEPNTDKSQIVLYRSALRAIFENKNAANTLEAAGINFNIAFCGMFIANQAILWIIPVVPLVTNLMLLIFVELYSSKPSKLLVSFHLLSRFPDLVQLARKKYG
jgi:Na+-translocating ferredoxin:NAD+ oxidoreductase RnfD subunit